MTEQDRNFLLQAASITPAPTIAYAAVQTECQRLLEGMTIAKPGKQPGNVTEFKTRQMGSKSRAGKKWTTVRYGSKAHRTK